MKTATQVQPEQRRGRPAAEPDSKARQSNDARFVDNRAEAVAQRKLADAIGGSTKQAAQRKSPGSRFGAPAQLQAGPEEDELQMKAAPDVLQRQGLEDEELLQGKFETAQRVEEEEEPLQGRFGAAQLKQKPGPQPNRTGLPDNLKSGIESLSGISMDNVKVHYNSAQPSQLNALAYAQGSDIHVAPGQEQHLPHEAWHLVQQAQGRVKPTMQMKDGVQVNDDAGLEQEADVMGGKAAVGAGQAREQKARPDPIIPRGAGRSISLEKGAERVKGRRP